MKIKFTNGNGDEADINIKGKCKITDYDTRTKLPDGKDLTVEVDGENVSIMNGTELKQNSQTVEMNANKYSIFTAIAGMDGDGSNLTENDIAKAKKVFKKGGESCDTLLNLGVTEIRYDSHAGVATIVIGEKELLRIDFQTRRERNGSHPDSNDLYEDPELSVVQPSLSKNDYDATRMREILDENGKPIKEIIKQPFKSYLKALAHRESRGIVDKVNKNGYVGLYQIGEEALADIGIYYKKSKNYKNNDWSGIFKKNKFGINSISEFKNSAEKQNLVIHAVMEKNWSYIKHYGLDKYIGQEINGQIITEAGLLAGAHLGGIGKLKQYIESRGKVDLKDGNDVKISVYIGEFAHYDMSNITGSSNIATKKELNEIPDKKEVSITQQPEKQIEDMPYIRAGHYKPNSDFKVYGPIMPPAGNREYTIKDGDSLIKIAKKFNTTVEKIKKTNKLKTDNIIAGKKLIIPPPEQKQV